MRNDGAEVFTVEMVIQRERKLQTDIEAHRPRIVTIVVVVPSKKEDSFFDPTQNR